MAQSPTATGIPRADAVGGVFRQLHRGAVYAVLPVCHDPVFHAIRRTVYQQNHVRVGQGVHRQAARRQHHILDRFAYVAILIQGLHLLGRAAVEADIHPRLLPPVLVDGAGQHGATRPRPRPDTNSSGCRCGIPRYGGGFLFVPRTCTRIPPRHPAGWPGNQTDRPAGLSGTANLPDDSRGGAPDNLAAAPPAPRRAGRTAPRPLPGSAGLLRLIGEIPEAEEAIPPRRPVIWLFLVVIGAIAAHNQRIGVHPHLRIPPPELAKPAPAGRQRFHSCPYGRAKAPARRTAGC